MNALQNDASRVLFVRNLITVKSLEYGFAVASRVVSEPPGSINPFEATPLSANCPCSCLLYRPGFGFSKEVSENSYDGLDRLLPLTTTLLLVLIVTTLLSTLVATTSTTLVASSATAIGLLLSTAPSASTTGATAVTLGEC